MFHLGHSRSSSQADHLLQTPDTFVRAPWPGMCKATAIVHASPACGARFVQYMAEFEAGGSLAPAPWQRFLYVLEGEIAVGDRRLAREHYAYLPSGHEEAVHAFAAARAVVIEKQYQPLDGRPAPPILIGERRSIAPVPFNGDPALEVRQLLPEDFDFDFAVNIMTYQPGACLPAVEVHVMEHGLLMLAGGGIYRLGERWYPVTAGDFIWMAPYCPQWFGALGNTPAQYLIYKDRNRHPLG
jgi:(S)-ureidoglycine aminohydrolase